MVGEKEEQANVVKIFIYAGIVALVVALIMVFAFPICLDILKNIEDETQIVNPYPFVRALVATT
jgi:hypothetical protein